MGYVVTALAVELAVTAGVGARRVRSVDVPAHRTESSILLRICCAAGFSGHAVTTCHPWPVARRSPSPPRRARLTAAHSGVAPAMAAAHQVTDLGFHFRAGRPIVGEPAGIGLGGAGAGQFGLVGTDRDGAAHGRASALGGQRATGAHPWASVCGRYALASQARRQSRRVFFGTAGSPQPAFRCRR